MAVIFAMLTKRKMNERKVKKTKEIYIERDREGDQQKIV